MSELRYLALALALGLASSSLAPGQQPAAQPSNCVHILFCLFNREALASDPAGIHKYSEDLIGLIVPPEAAKADFEPLAGRLARAEQMARTGKGKLIAEADVVRAFNELMAKVAAPSTLRTNETSMRRFRQHAESIKAFPALFSAARNGTNCNPGEAVFLLHLLISDDGVLYERNLDSAQALMRRDFQHNGGGSSFGVAGMERPRLPSGTSFCFQENHNRKATAALFNSLAGILGF